MGGWPLCSREICCEHLISCLPTRRRTREQEQPLDLHAGNDRAGAAAGALHAVRLIDDDSGPCDVLQGGTSGTGRHRQYS